MARFDPSALRIALLYALFGVVWILLSDDLILSAAPDARMLAELGMWKGLAFVLVTSCVLYLVVRRKPILASEGDRPVAPGVWPLVLVFVLLASVIVVVGLLGVAYHFSAHKSAMHGQLRAISDLKIGQIRSWLDERRGDARILAGATVLQRLDSRFPDGAGDSVTGQLNRRLDDYRQAYGYHAVLLVDKHGRQRAASGVSGEPVTESLRATLNRAFDTGETQFTDLYRLPDGRIVLDFVAPVRLAGAGAFAVVLRSDPKKFLYPLIRAWPVPSETAETLLIRSEADRVLYLNDLRHHPGSAMTLRLPTDAGKLLAAQVLTGDAAGRRLLDGVDYRGVAVVGVADRVPGTDWHMIAKIDKAELYAESGHEAGWIILVDTLVLVIAAVASILIHQRREMRLTLARQLAQEEQLRSLRLLDCIAEGSSDAIYAKDAEGRYLLFNAGAARLVGRSGAEVIGKDDLAIFTTEAAARIKERDARIMADGETETYEETLPVADGQRIFLTTKGPMCDAEGKPVGVFGISRDITEAKQWERELERLAHFDTLTGLPNRLLILSRLDHALERARRHDYQVGVLYLDLDHFKTVNDSLGHPIGDELLVAVSERLKKRLRDEDTLGRMGGDEFLIVLDPVAGIQEATTVAMDLLAVLAEPFRLSVGREVFAQGSLGICFFPRDGTSPDELLRNADAALFRAKADGRNRFCFYAEAMNAEALANLGLEEAMQRALKRGEFLMHYQPKVDLRGGGVRGAEALLRWRREDGELVSPQAFIPVAERTNLIVTLGAWVIDAVCRQLRAWLDDGLTDIQVAVNISARQFQAGGLDRTVAEALARHGVAPRHLELEVTESMLMAHPDEAAAMLGRLKAMGLKLSLDDFGTGYSSLSYLTRFPFDVIKIDQSFVRDLVSQPASAAIAVTIIAMAHRLGLRVVAEGVETEAQLGYLRTQGCDEMQGYLFSRPVPAEAFVQLLKSGRHLDVGKADDCRQGTLLLLDDEPGILSALRRLLRGEGYRILTAGNAEEAFDLLARNPVQVIVSDQRMPDMNGTEFLGRVKALYPDTVRLVLSGYADMETVVRAINEGAIYKFLGKPWDDEVLRAQLREAFRYYEAVVVPRRGE